MRHDARRCHVPALVAALAGAAVLLSLLWAAATPAATTQAKEAGRDGAAARALALGTITSFSPASVPVGSGAFTLTMGLNPAASAEASWTAQWSGASGLFPLSVGSVETTSVSVAVPAAAVTEPGAVTVSLSDGVTAWSGGYSVTATAPHIDTISPENTAAGSAAFTLRVNGSDFATGAMPAYITWNGARLSEATPTGPVNPTAILYASVPAAAVLTPGVATVRVVNPLPGGGAESNAVSFAVFGPALTGISPATGGNSTTALSFTLSGTDLGLAGPPRVVQLRGTGANTATVITATGVAYEPPLIPGGQGRIVGVFNLANITGAAVPVAAPPGKYDVHMTFTNDGPKSYALAQAFEVTGPAITGISPANATNGMSSLALTLTGNALNTLMSPVVTLKGPGATGTTVVTATGVNANVAGTTLTCRFDLTSPTVAPAGLYDLTITYGGGKTLTKAQALTITNAAPVVATVSPNVTWAGSAKPTTLTITGSGFVPAPPLAGATGSRVRIGARLATTTTFVSSTKLTVPLTAADVAAPGVVPVTVDNPTPGGGTSQPASLTVGIDTSAPTTTIAGADDAWHNLPVALTVTATDTQSGVQRTQWTQNGSAPATLSGASITVPAPPGGAGDGIQRITVWSTDWCNHVENPPASVTVRIDTVGPRTYASAPASVKKKAKLKLRYRADDLTPQCAVTLKIKKANGTVARAYNMGKRTSYKSYSYTVKANLAKGRYKFYVYAKDLADNRQTRLGTDAFRVK